MDIMSLPNEDLVGICEQLDDESLSNFMKSNSRIYQVCKGTLRKKLFEILNGSWYNNLYPYQNEVHVSFPGDKIYVHQIETGGWKPILTNMKSRLTIVSDFGGDKINYTKVINIDDPNEIKKLKDVLQYNFTKA